MKIIVENDIFDKIQTKIQIKNKKITENVAITRKLMILVIKIKRYLQFSKKISKIKKNIRIIHGNNIL